MTKQNIYYMNDYTKLAQIHLLGIFIVDPIGDTRLRKALSQEQPDAITIGISEKLVEYFDGEWLSDQMAKLQSYNGLNPTVKNFIEYQIQNIYRFPVTVSKEYAQSRGIPVHFIGEVEDVDKMKKTIRAPNMSSSEQINTTSTKEKMMRDAQIRYRTYQRWFSNPSYQSHLQMNEFVQSVFPDDPHREVVTAKNLTTLAHSISGKIVHITDAALLTDDIREQSLYERIKQLKPTRNTIADYM